MKKLLTLAFATLAFFTAGTSMAANAAATYYVSQSSGNDANDGKSLATAWKTFGKLNAFKLAPGDKVVVAPGLQEESLKPMGGGTADNPVVIQFLPGIHTINIRNVTRVPLFVSNTMDSEDPKPVGILLEGCKHLRLQGGGVEGEKKTTILYDGKMVQLCNNHSEDITFTGLVFDLKRPTVSEIRVLEAGTAYAVIQVAEGSDYSVEDGKFRWRGDWGPGAFCQKLDLKEGRCRRFRTPRGWEAQGQTVATARDLGGRKVRLDYPDGESGLEPGHQYHFRNIKRDSVGVHNNRSKDIIFKDCDFYALTGMGFVSQFTENITFQRVNVAPPRETIRTCPAWADILHFSNCKGNILIDSCRFSGMQDDAINCHGTYLYIVEKTKSNQVLVRFMHRQTYGFPAFVPGDEVAVICGPKTREYPDNPRRKVTALERKSDRDWLLTLDGDVPHFQDKDVIDNRTWHPNITVCNNHFSVAPVSGLNLLTPGKALVENNTFHRCRTCGVGMAVDSLSWFESAPVRDVLIRGNTFIECGVWVNPDLSVVQPEEPIHENIRIIDNVFVQTGVKAKGVRKLTITGNRSADGPLALTLDPSCTELKIENNAVLLATAYTVAAAEDLTLNIAPAHALVFPGTSAGTADADIKNDSIALKNDVLSAKWQIASKQLRGSMFENRLEKTSLGLPADLFVLETSTGRIASSECVLESTAIEELKKDPRALRNAEHVSGKCVVANLRHVASGIKVCWRAELRDGANALRSKITVMAGNEQIVISKIILLDGGVLAGAETIGTAQASPVAGSGIFLGFENPLVWNTVKEGRVTCVDNNPHTLAARQSHTASIILGVYPKGQLRRAFLCYIEQERPRPYQAWLHYNTWYDLSWRDPSSVIRVCNCNEAQVLDVIHGFGEELVKKRGVRLDSFLIDEGWDDPATVWGIDQKNWPHAFTAVQKAAAQYDANISAWFSPVGGYLAREGQRLAAGRKLGISKFSLSDPIYYRRFREQCMSFVSEYGVNGFKFDGIGKIDNIDPAIRLFGDLRSVRQDVFINLTTGSWPSPFWLLLADATYHGEGDYGFCHKGSARQRWITFRDGAVYAGVVQKGPLFPLNSIMNGGIIYATNAPGAATAWAGTGQYVVKGEGGLNVDLGNDFRDEIRSYFASGTQLQEFYISHRLMTATNWDYLAAAAKWSRSRQDCLVDVHWIGGNPRNGEVYGWAAWTEKGGVLALRNPDDKPATITLDPATAFELPEGAPRNYQLCSPYPDQRVQKMAFNAGQPVEFQIQPFELLVFDALASEKK